MKGPLVDHDNIPSKRVNGFDLNAYKLLAMARCTKEDMKELVKGDDGVEDVIEASNSNKLV